MVKQNILRSRSISWKTSYYNSKMLFDLIVTRGAYSEERLPVRQRTKNMVDIRSFFGAKVTLHCNKNLSLS